ncbi:MAG: CRISPR-associated endonuclease Cas2 [Candidatus Hydrogenedentes bacterium]|nr:CRISPR-associated endonuclease Cas2 [Candidatus Hydrogenedentota bacterium]
MRRCYLVGYDIRDPKRLRRVHRILRGYGEAWQYSIFFCVLKDIDRVRLQTDLEGEMNLKEDQTLFIDLGPNEKEARKNVTVIGQALPQYESGFVVI